MIDMPYEALARAVVKKAAKDYRREPKRREEVARFFTSRWGGLLLGELDGTRILKQLEAEVAARRGI